MLYTSRTCYNYSDGSKSNNGVRTGIYNADLRWEYSQLANISIWSSIANRTSLWSILGNEIVDDIAKSANRLAAQTMHNVQRNFRKDCLTDHCKVESLNHRKDQGKQDFSLLRSRKDCRAVFGLEIGHNILYEWACRQPVQSKLTYIHTSAAMSYLFAIYTKRIGTRP